MVDDEFGAGGVMMSRGNRSTRRKLAPVLLCSPEIIHDLGSNQGLRGGKPVTNRLSYDGLKKSVQVLSVSTSNVSIDDEHPQRCGGQRLAFVGLER
jgi:hypothetical protein